MKTRIETPSPRVISDAAERLHRGELVVIPTETVYGLAGSTRDPAALQSIFEIKGRPSDNPLIAHVDGPIGARSITNGWDERCDRLSQAFWPGPLTMVLHRQGDVPQGAAGGRDTLAVRSPSHPVARELLDAFGGPLSAPSANRSGSISPTTAQHVAMDLDGDHAEGSLLIIDGGACTVGIESTVLDLTTDPPRVLRPGSITNEAIAELIGNIEAPVLGVQDASPGTQSRHYAPATPMELVEPGELADRIGDDPSPVIVIRPGDAGSGEAGELLLPADPGGFAEGLYDALRRADAMGLSRILVVVPGTGSPWRAVRDRLDRAAATSR